MRHAVVVLFLAILARPGNALEKKPFEAQTIKGLSYADKDADKVRHKLDLYLPKGAKDYPVLFFIHGGGWQFGSKDGFSRHGKTFAENGIGFVAINYRLSPAVKHPEHIKDVAQAFAFSRNELKKHGADLSKIYVSGHSAGGHLCALLASDESYLKAHKLSLKDIKGCIPISGVFTVGRGGRAQSKIWGDDSELIKKASPMAHVTKDLPPFLIFYAKGEPLGRQAEAFHAALKKAGASTELKAIEGRDHGSIMRNAARPDDEVAVAILAFIKGKSK